MKEKLKTWLGMILLVVNLVILSIMSLKYSPQDILVTHTIIYFSVLALIPLASCYPWIVESKISRLIGILHILASYKGAWILAGALNLDYSDFFYINDVRVYSYLAIRSVFDLLAITYGLSVLYRLIFRPKRVC